MSGSRDLKGDSPPANQLQTHRGILVPLRAIMVPEVPVVLVLLIPRRMFLRFSVFGRVNSVDGKYDGGVIQQVPLRSVSPPLAGV